jgi:phage baseplate assembly protein W
MSRLTRAQTLSPGSNREVEIYSDFTNNMLITPVGEQLARVINVNSVKQSIKNLILTNTGERPFQPNIGGNIHELLFEHNVDENLVQAEYYISRVLELYEPRIQLLQVKVSSSESNENLINITVVYRTLNNTEPQTFTIIFKRVR